MMSDVLGVIYTGENDHLLENLTRSRSIAALPIFARYRIIDFFLSNLVNSGVRNVGVITQKNYRSLMDHISGGREWDLNRKRDGLFILPPFITNENPGSYTGVTEALRGVSTYLRRSSQKYVIFCDSTILYKADFRPLLEYHIEKKADITCMYWHADKETIREMNKPVILDVARGGRIKGIAYDPIEAEGPRVMNGTFIADKDLLLRLIDTAISGGDSRFVQGVLLKNLEKLRIFGYRCNGYTAPIHSIKLYFNSCMDILDDKIRAELFMDPKAPIATKVRDEMPTHYIGRGSAVNSSIADGCIIEGEVKDSVVFRGVKIGRNVTINNCILMQDCEIGDNCTLENVIVDKEAIIRSGKTLIGQDTYPVVIAKGAII